MAGVVQRDSEQGNRGAASHEGTDLVLGNFYKDQTRPDRYEISAALCRRSQMYILFRLCFGLAVLGKFNLTVRISYGCLFGPFAVEEAFLVV